MGDGVPHCYMAILVSNGVVRSDRGEKVLLLPHTHVELTGVRQAT